MYTYTCICRYGADCVEGMHSDPPIAFTEEFQSSYLSSHFGVFNEMRSRGVLVGEHVWNFADFMTTQGVTRVVGNRKGVFTRQRQPKAGAFTMRSRYLQLANLTMHWPLSLAQLNLLVGESGGSGGAAEQARRLQTPMRAAVASELESAVLAEDEADRESQRAQVEGTLRAEIARDSDLGGELGPEFGQTMDERQVAAEEAVSDVEVIAAAAAMDTVAAMGAASAAGDSSSSSSTSTKGPPGWGYGLEL